jgi:dihydroflavonol-4-reductase
MRVFITGADGILGNNLVRMLLDNGHEVSVFIETGKRARFLEELPIRMSYGCILNYHELKRAMEGSGVVIHAAAITDTVPPQHPKYRKINIEGTLNILAAVKELGIRRLIHVGTANSFGAGDERDPGDETCPFRAARYGLDYIATKKVAQDEVLRAVAEDGVDAVVVNPTFMIGPWDSKPSSGKMILAICSGKLPGYPKGGRNFVHVRDVAQGIISAIDKGQIGSCYILGNENLSYRDAFRKMAVAMGVKTPWFKIPRPMALAYGRLVPVAAALFRFKPSVNYPMARISTEKHYYTSDKAVRELGMPQTPLSIAIEEAVAWFREHAYIKA